MRSVGFDEDAPGDDGCAANERMMRLYSSSGVTSSSALAFWLEQSLSGASETLRPLSVVESGLHVQAVLAAALLCALLRQLRLATQNGSKLLSGTSTVLQPCSGISIWASTFQTLGYLLNFNLVADLNLPLTSSP